MCDDENMTNEELARSVYLGFVESEGGSSHPFQDAWDAYEDEHGTIELGSAADKLFQAAILYALDNR